MRPADHLRSAPFRIAAWYAALFAASVLVLFGAVFWLTTSELDHQLRADIDQDMHGLMLRHAASGLTGLKRGVQLRLHDHPGPDYYYLVMDAGGHVVAGNTPPVAPFSGWRRLSIHRPGQRSSDERSAVIARGLVERGDFAMVGRSLHTVIEVQEVLLRSLALALLLTLLLALAGGVAMSRKALRRVEAINRTTREIVGGALSRRVPVSGARDELDDLAHSINRMLDRIQELMENLEQVSSDIAHDLRTPLGRLRQGLERARCTEHTVAGLQAALERALAETDDILATFGALLRIAQIEAGARRRRFDDIDLAEIGQRIADAYESVAEDNGQHMSARIADAAPARGDRDLLTQMLANLVENAIRHTPPGTHITLEVAAGEHGPLVRVRDDGPGIPDAHRDKVTRRFYRLEQSRTTPGSGLGLALVNAIAKLHGARLTLADAGPGLDAYLCFPAVNTG